MARPQKEGLDYFPHDVYASSDEKIEPLILLYGSKGYGFYFIHLEYIYRNNSLEFDISDAETREVICQKLRISDEEYNQILKTALKKKCFDEKYYQETGKLTSNGIKKRASVVTKKREKMRALYGSEDEKISAAETMEETEEETPQSKVKESKEKKRKEEYTKEFELFYSEYPRPENKHQSFTNWKTCLKKYSVDQLMAACRNYKAAKTGTEIQFLKSSSNFLGREKPFEDYINYTQPEIKQQAQAQQAIIKAPDWFKGG